jgi:hypothetical protein
MTLPAHKDWMQMALKQLLLTGTVMYWLLTEKRFQEALTLYDTMCSFVNSGGVITELVSAPWVGRPAVGVEGWRSEGMAVNTCYAMQVPETTGCMEGLGSTAHSARAAGCQ